MASPVKPSDITAVIPAASTTLADAMLSTMKFSLVFYNFYSWMYNSDGTFSDAFIVMYCNAKGNCT